MNTKNLKLHCIYIFSIFSISHCYAVMVGDSFGGGTVFCVSNTADTSQCTTETGRSGDYGLIMANEDQANYDSPNHGVTWSSAYTAVPGARSDDNGEANTTAILASLPDDNPRNNAAWLCHNYRDRENHTYWYLPSKNELNKMYLYARANNLIGRGCTGKKDSGIQCLVGGYDNNIMVYWSSTEYSGYGYDYQIPWYQHFSTGNQSNYGMFLGCYGVRAIQIFNNREAEAEASEQKEQIVAQAKRKEQERRPKEQVEIQASHAAVIESTK